MSDPTGEEEFTELVDPDITRVDAVKGGANGTRFLMAKSADDQPTGLFAPEFVRELVEKADAEAQPAPSDTVTVTGRPESIAAMMRQMHAAVPDDVQKAAADHAEYVAFIKAKYTAEEKRKLASRGHAIKRPGGEPDYPIDDADDLGKAIKAVGRGGADHDKIRAYIIRRARAMGMSDQIPDNWAGDGSLKQAAMAKADGMGAPAATGADPGSPAWEAQDASSGQAILDQLLALRSKVQTASQREGAEVGNGHMDDIGDVCDLQQVDCLLMEAAKLLGGFVVAEQAEAGAGVAKTAEPTPPPAASAAPSPQESTVSDTQGGAAATTETTAAADVAKGGEGALSEAQLAEFGRQFLAKAAKKAAKKAKQTSGATPAPADNARVIPGTDTVQSPAQGPDDVAKAAAAQLAPFGEAMASVVKQLGELATQMGSQTGRVEKALAQPDDRRSPMLNGATGEAGLAPSHYGRGFQSRPEFAPIQKALDALPDGPEKEQAQRDVAIAAIKGRFSQQ